MLKEDIGIYIHIPFCANKCYYCNFISYTNLDDLIEKYIDAVCIEILKNAEILSEYNIKTVYFGGGTPSYIDERYIEKIMNTLKLFSKCSQEDSEEFVEVTIEVNPNSANLEKLLAYRNCGINRLSIGVQSTYDTILKNIGRVHNHKDVIYVLENANKVGFDNISVDVIYPLPDLSLDMFNDTLQELKNYVKKYNVKHVSVYNLEIHENTKLDFLLKENFLSLPDEEEEYKMRELLEKELDSIDFEKYEISNYSLKGYTSKHNLMYWKQEKYLGFGASSSSFFYGSRYKNVDDVNEYIDSIINDKNVVCEKEELDKLSLMKEYIILNLRLVNGINLEEFKRKFNKDIFDLFKEEFDYFINNGLIICKDNKLCLSKRGKEVANVVWEKFV